MSWYKLYDFNHFYPVHTSNYDISQVIDHEPSFNWWVRHTLDKCDHIISIFQKEQTIYLNKTHKFGIESPNTLSEVH